MDREYALGDLRATFRGVRTSFLRELRGKRRVVAVVGARATVDRAVAEARVYRRRLTAADAVVVPVYTDGAADPAGGGRITGEAESKYLWAAAEPAEWVGYFSELLSARGLVDGGGGAWLGLNFKGRAFGSALDAPRWDEVSDRRGGGRRHRASLCPCPPLASFSGRLPGRVSGLPLCPVPLALPVAFALTLLCPASGLCPLPCL
eukprot:1125550-Prymnesium_polylepis.1